MAYGERYFVTYCDSYGVPARISILENNFVGTATELTGGEDPILITYDSPSDFLYEPIRPSSAQINLVFDSNFQMEGMWTADERKYKVIHYVDGNVDWIGWVIPDGFEHEYHGGIYMASITASDGLSTLEKIQFVYDNGDTYGRQDLTYNNGAEFPFSLIATEVLRKLNLDIDTWICDDVWELEAVKQVWWPNEYYNDRRADPWSVSFVNVRTYINDSDKDGIPYYKVAGNAWNCKDVIENILRLHGCILFQENGCWKIYRINIQENFSPAGNQRYWVKYNALNVYIGKEPFGSEKIIPSGSNGEFMVGNDHVMRMDQVYSLYRMYYQFTFKRDGDTPKNLIKNGTFEGDNAFSSPTGGCDNWIRWRSGNKWFPRVRQAIPNGGGLSTIPAGINTSVRFGLQADGVSTTNTDPYAAVWAGLKQTPDISINKGDKLHLSMNIKIQAARGNLKGGFCYVGLIKIVLSSDDGQWYYLVNKVRRPGDSTVGQGYLGAIDTQWVKNPDQRGLSDNFLAVPPGNYNDIYYRWWGVSFNVPEAPASGIIEFTIHGLGNPRGRKSDSFPPFRVHNRFIGERLPEQPFEPTPEIEEVATVRSSWPWDGSDVPPIEFTNIKFERIVANTEELAEKIEYVYHNDNPNYTLNPDPVEVFNGDVEDENHISKITTSYTSNGKNFWRPFMREEISYASLGLITCRSIMNQYYRPNRILEGTVKADTIASFSSRFGFHAIPGIRFVLMRATFNKKRNYIQDATFRQITTIPGEEGCPGSENPEEPIPDIPDGGGTEGGNNIDPEWIATGDIECQKSGGVNTGGTIIKEKDNNPNSETYGEIRWVSGEDDLNMCPIGEPSMYIWGVDDQMYDVDNFIEQPFFRDEDDPRVISVNYTNIEGNKYLYFLHRSGTSTGLVERVFTIGQPGNIISDWQYLSDININGYNYRVLRTDYTLAEFSVFYVNFVFNQNQN